jgi:transcription-repair coupling factor (superfamily II helicase)
MLESIGTSYAPLAELGRRAATLARGERLSVAGLAGSLDALAIATVHEMRGGQVLVLMRERAAAERLRDDLSLVMPRGAVRFLGGAQRPVDGEGVQDVSDIETLRALLEGESPVIVTYPRALLQPLPVPEAVSGKAFSVSVGAAMDLTALVERLVRQGFQTSDFVQAHGDIALRGGILDVFPYTGEDPVRIEFSGDIIESLRAFDPASQRSIRELSSATIVPDLLARSDDADRTSVSEYLMDDALLISFEPDVRAADLEGAAASGNLPGASVVAASLDRFPALHLCLVGVPAGERIDLLAQPQPAFNGSIHQLRAWLVEMSASGFSTHIACDTSQELTRLKDLLGSIDDAGGERAPLDLDTVTFSTEAVHEGFVLPDARLAVLTEHQIFNRLKRRGGKRRPRFKGFTRQDLQLLRRGDYVVHEDYGIGRFDGLQRIRVRNIEQEVVRVLYEEKDVLYVNLNYVTKLQKYSSREGHIPKLSRLGTPDWERLKSRTKKRVKDIARELITLYAKRKHSPGFAFPADTPWQKEMEASFLYEDTFDQAKTTLDIKQDMEKPYPMDRLVCGDVGFGKTEVAVRAAFKAVTAGKQVAVLVPTTILAEQHYNTFLDRIGRYGVHVAVMSRFKPRKDQKTVLERLSDGAVDLVIGTHRLLSKDVHFKDLGLLIVDEEHRFGVSAKEKLRHLRTQVDTLAMTATPIPRTLHFSLMGARDLSIIATPPRNRLPVVTEIMQWGDDVVRDAVLRELHRGGQVYLVHDRIQTIEEMAARVRTLLPGVRVRAAHGRMRAHELEEVMVDFLEKRIDVLVSTKIIESGLDIPNVNTIIVHRADRFGMAELHQLRGRVGRSNQQAFALLITPPVSVLPRGTLQRLQAMEEFTELGAGFNLAMRDLEIRGAGNLLGSEQSGFIETMGFETYTRILDDAVQELKEEEFQDLFAGDAGRKHRQAGAIVEPEFDALIPESYVQHDVERLAIYRRLYGLETAAQLQEVMEELRDRFGTPPQEVLALFGAVRVRLAATRAGFTRVRLGLDRTEYDFPPESDERFYNSELFQTIMRKIPALREDGLSLRQNGPTLTLVVRVRTWPDPGALIESQEQMLQMLTAG